MLAQLSRVIDEADARQLPALIAEWTDAGEAHRWIARALRIDLALLTERPELAIPCVQRRCAWLGAPRESLFLAYPRKAPEGAAVLREVVELWLAEWRPGRRWLRSVRPPQVPLDGGVVEEYRTAQNLWGRLAFSRDGTAIGITSPTAETVAWERVTGRRMTEAELVVPQPAWRLAPESRWGNLVVESRGRRVARELPDDIEATGVFEVDRELVVVGLHGMEGDRRHAGFDVARGELVWEHAGDCACAVSAGSYAFIAQHDRVVVRDTRSGEQLGEWFVSDVREIAVASDGTVATRSGHVIRVWDVMAALATKLAPRPVRGWTPAQFSPDGQRLLTGGLLCDGRDGDLVAVLDVDGPGYLEGGPPMPCQRLTNARLVEVGPFGLNLWESRTGAPTNHREVRAHTFDAACFDPRGLYMAIARDHRQLVVYGLQPVALLHERELGELATANGARLGFSPDGDLLWWETVAGERWALPIGDPSSTGLLGPDEVLPEEPGLAVSVEDGLLVIGELAIPIDDDTAVRSRDGRAFASATGHFVLEP